MIHIFRDGESSFDPGNSSVMTEIVSEAALFPLPSMHLVVFLTAWGLLS